VLGIRLSRNFGHQNALVAGMTSLYNKFDVYISIDADLQDDIGMIPQMVNYYHADFRLIDNQVLGEFLNFGESNLYLRGIFPGIGFNQSSVYYSRKERKAGEPKYTWGKSMALAWQGITSFSVKPLQLILVLGIITFIIAIGISVWAFVEYILGNTLRGWFSMILPLSFFGGIQMISIGILGEYIGKIYTEVKGRPRFIIRERLGGEE